MKDSDFSKIYLDIINRNETALGYFDKDEHPIPIFLNSFKIINEYVKDPDLTHVPKTGFH